MVVTQVVSFYSIQDLDVVLVLSLSTKIFNDLKNFYEQIP